MNQASDKFGELITLFSEAQSALNRLPVIERERDAACAERDRVRKELADARVEIEQLKALIPPEPAPKPPPPVPFARTPMTGSADADLAIVRASPPPATNDEPFSRTFVQWYKLHIVLFLETGDTMLVDKLESVMNDKIDAVRTHPPNKATVYESMFCPLPLLHALVMRANGRAWEMWLDTWKARYPRGVIPEDLTHGYFATLESYTYLAALTGEQVYIDERDRRAKVVRAHVQDFDHLNQRLPIDEAQSNVIAEAPRLDYMEYTLLSVLLLREANVVTVPPVVFAATIARCIRDNGTATFRIDGTNNGTQTYDAAKWRGGALPLLGAHNEQIRNHNALVREQRDSVFLAAARVYKGR